jgi:hypothetical protein
MAEKLDLGDVVSFGWTDGYDTGTVCQVHADGTVDVFRPYTHTADFVGGGRGPGSASVICYVGIEVVRNLNPVRLKLLRKGGPLR